MLSHFQSHLLIAQSFWFDADFYLKQNADIAASGLDPVTHYLEYGARENRVPHPDFDLPYYLEQCEARGIEVENPLLHYLLEGEKLGLQVRRPPPSSVAHDEQQWMLNHLLASGCFDRDFYNSAYNFNFESDLDALRHFFFEGFRQGNRPNLYFDPVWYLNHYPDLRSAEIHPLFHYVVAGDVEGRQPSLIFDSKWYRSHYSIAKEENALTHYLRNARSCNFSPIPEFDVKFYGDVNKDVRNAGIDAFQHFLFTGYREGRNPSADFNIKYYVKRYLGGNLSTNPLLHYLEHKHEPGVFGKPPQNEPSIPRLVKQFSKPAAEFEEFKPIHSDLPKKAKVLAYYLPQFHAFPENDGWWGSGFTEWTNIARGVSRFDGHYQPRIPRDLGFYSLEDAIPTLRRQIQLAKGGGVHGFVFYYYWFNGKRLMERPVEQFLKDHTLDMPFCLMWANENWTRRWDGDEQEVLISQDYDPDDDERLVSDFVRHFSDKRYIRVQGRPLLMIYRPGIIPDVRDALGRWRKVFIEKFNENPILIMAQAFDDTDPGIFGFDAAIEFPPHKLTAHMPSINDSLDYLDVEFTGKVFSYDDVVARSLNEPTPSYPLIKTAVPGWDNDARRQGTGLIMQGASPAKYEAWMRTLIQKARQTPFFGENFVCVNAWNEWCEAAYLEPDLHYGSAYLNATGRAVTGISTASNDSRLLLIGHDAFPSGAQHLLLNIARRLQSDHGVQIEFLLLGSGALVAAYQDVGKLTVATDTPSVQAFLDSARKRGFVNAIVNTVAATHILPLLQNAGIEAMSLVHELPRIIREKRLQEGARLAFSLSRHIVFASEVVMQQLAAELEIQPDDRVRIIPQGLYKNLEYSAVAVESVRKEFKLKKGEKLILGVGYADLRKGFDLFLQLWRQLNQTSGAKYHFCWVGDIDPGLKDWLSTELKDAISAGRFHMTGYRQNVAPYLFAADAYALTSREDPFPTVIHEALSVGMPVFAFEGAGGMSSFLVQNEMGTVVPYGDVIAMAGAISAALRRPLKQEIILQRKAFVREKLDFSDYVNQLLKLALPQLASVSIAIPNYNYAKFMPERLGTVFQQNHPVHEVLVLDDCSTDESLNVIPQVATEWGRTITLLPNTVNSGSVFAQWRKAAEMAKGEFVWIAEADDLSDPTFLSTVIAAMQSDERIGLGFSDSRSINLDGSPLWDSYKGYYSQQEPGALSRSEIFEGVDFIRHYLAVRNLILNVSAVVWRRETLLRALEVCRDELKDFRMAGDWRLYIEALSQPGARLAYIAEPLNVHRRHAESVTHALKAAKHIAEIATCHNLVKAKVKLPASIQSMQKKYLDEVSTQLQGPQKKLAKKTATALKNPKRSKRNSG